MTRHSLRLVIISLLLCCSIISVFARSLEKDFSSPPASARPWVYWFWLNGNITREGITADLEAMKRVGIGGVLIMEVDQGSPLGPIGFMSPEWRDLFKHVVNEAQRLGLEVNMNNDAGWNGSGGPWIKPEQSMQKVVWTETDVAGPKHFEDILQQPQTVAGYYRDITVLAFPTPGSYRIPDMHVRAAYQVGGVGPAPEKDLPAEMIIDRSRIIDLSSQMDESGRLSWDVPQGKWTIVRFGHTCTGAENSPAPVSGRGLECDKLSKEGVEANFNGMMAKLIADVGPAAGQTLTATHVDSWENGSQNWTARMREEFQQRRGYDLLPFLPVMMGRVVGSPDVSERFLWDLRRTISELVVENYAGHLRDLAHAGGLKFTIEAYGSPCDNIPYGGIADEPMGEFWMGGGAMETCRGMASAAHTYGKPIVGAEAFTAGDPERWRDHPASIKALGDRAFCEGINRFVFHRYALQPWVQERNPGMTMGPWGLHYERTQTWWEQSTDWHNYLARCQFLLRQGLFAADICYLQPEAPPYAFSNHNRKGYDWDECSAEVVLTRMSVKNGRIVLPDGMSYKLLALPDSQAMTPALLRKIKELVEAGATVVGSRPLRSPGLSNYPKCDEEVKRLAEELWGDCDGKSVKERRFGRGRIVCGVAPEKVLAELGVQRDFSSIQGLRYIHRIAGDTDIYFVANAQPNRLTAACTFRVSGKVPELWWPDTGRTEPAAVFQENKGVTNVLLPLGPSGSVFVVFRKGSVKNDPVVSVNYNGKQVISTLQPPLQKVVVHKAVYGVLDDPQKTRDVRIKVQNVVNEGDYSFPVSLMAEGDDPAYGIVKTLVVDYTIKGKQFTVKGQDPDIIHLTGDGVKITVEKAVYGMLDDPKRTRDVRSKVQSMADSGERSFTVARLAAGDDPAPLHHKTLVLEYLIDGKRVTISGTDADTIDLAPPMVNALPPCELKTDGNRVKLTAQRSGEYMLVRANGKKSKINVPSLPGPLQISGPWTVLFPPNEGAPEKIEMNALISWPDHSDSGVKHFSGTATYRTSFEVPTSLLAKGHLLNLNLGDVQVIAQVKLNGKDLGMLWKPPFSLNVNGALKPGTNDLEVKVTNLWPNRMVGDEYLPEDSDRNPDGTLKSWPQWLIDGKPSPTGRFTFTSWRLWKKEHSLLESGLIGPVTIQTAYEAVVE